MAEALVDKLGRGRFKGYSAGSHPKGRVHPLALELIAAKQLPVDGLRSKDWSEFAAPAAPKMDFIFTVCDNAASEMCPVWPGHPTTAHWGLPDPAAVEGSEEERRKAFSRTWNELESRIALFVNLPIASLDALALKGKVQDIGRALP
jgi:arsenate reductase